MKEKLEHLKESDVKLKKVWQVLGGGGGGPDSSGAAPLPKPKRGEKECHLCNPKKVFQHHWQLVAHFKRWHLGITKYQCNVCQKFLMNKYFLDQHKKSHMSSPEKKKKYFRYLQCTVLCATQKSLEKHVSEKHSQTSQSFECVFCSKKFPVLRNCKAHEKRCPENQHKDEFQCSFCDNPPYPTLRAVNRHMRDKHSYGKQQ